MTTKRLTAQFATSGNGTSTLQGAPVAADDIVLAVPYAVARYILDHTTAITRGTVTTLEGEDVPSFNFVIQRDDLIQDGCVGMGLEVVPPHGLDVTTTTYTINLITTAAGSIGGGVEGGSQQPQMALLRVGPSVLGDVNSALQARGLVTDESGDVVTEAGAFSATVLDQAVGPLTVRATADSAAGDFVDHQAPNFH
jgi:hypothetical protein